MLDETHIHFFTKQGITELLDASGYDIIELRRVLCHPLRSEIHIKLNSPNDYEAMRYLLKHNAECLVYQYVIKACVKNKSSHRPTAIENNGDLDKMRHLEHKLLRKFYVRSSK